MFTDADIFKKFIGGRFWGAPRARGPF